MKKAKDVRADHLPLLLDPGVICRLDDFLKFYRENHSFPAATAFEIRDMFANSLGETIVWRGMILQGDEPQRIAREGIKARSFSSEYRDKIRVLFDGNIAGQSGGRSGPIGILDALHVHLTGLTEASPLISVSKWASCSTQGTKLAEDQSGLYNRKFGW